MDLMSGDSDQNVQATDDPMAATPDQVAMGMRKWFRRVAGIIMFAALVVIVVRGIYVVMQVTNEAG